MAKDLLRLKQIFKKTDGRCHICHCRLSFDNHGKTGAKGAWHIEHSVPRACGGTNHLNNLFPACIGCNLDKGIVSSRTARSSCGNTRAPYSRTKKQKVKDDNTGTGILVGSLIGLIGGPWGVVIGATLGGMIGSENSPRV
ncbi:MAG: hypothetical protein KF856_05345 [Cyclobacteriaceae bacterium]|nr:hypothetical protein [Cyclobacteriaceae bacterium]